jgi:hypothetical protein
MKKDMKLVMAGEEKEVTVAVTSAHLDALEAGVEAEQMLRDIAFLPENWKIIKSLLADGFSDFSADAPKFAGLKSPFLGEDGEEIIGGFDFAESRGGMPPRFAAGAPRQAFLARH